MIEVESYLINTLICWPEEIPDAAASLKAEDFAQGRQGTIFAELVAIASRGVGVDLATVLHSLKASGNLDAAGGAGFLMELTDNFSAGAALVPEHCRIIREAAQRRDMRNKLQEALEALQDPTKPLVEVAGMAESAALAGVAGVQGTGPKRAGSFLPEIYKTIEAQSKGEVTGLRTGFYELDQRLSGFQPADLIVLGGRPRMGKTALAADIAFNIGCNQKAPVLFFELEMTSKQIVQRKLLTLAKINGQVLRSGKLPQRDYPRLALASAPIDGANVYLDDKVGLTPLQMFSIARRHRMKHGLSLIVVDNIQKMKSDFGQRDKRLEVVEVTNALKNIAKDLNVPVLAISHLSRAPDLRPDHEPTLSDLQESGNIEQDADIVLFLYRHEVYEEVPPEKRGESKLILAKYREGSEGYIPLFFNEDFASFENWGGNRIEPGQSHKEKQAGEEDPWSARR